MSYISPITIFDDPMETTIQKVAHSIEAQKEEYIYKAVCRIGIDVDKDELRRALRYDRDQYEHGRFDGYTEARAEFERRWIPTRERLPEEPGFYLATVMIDDPVANGYKLSRAYGSVNIIYFTTAHTWADWDFEDVTAWMPLPEPYKKNPLDDLKCKIDEFNKKKEEDT